MTRPDVFAPAQLGPVTLRNRVVKAATFESRTPDGLVTDDLVDYHLAVARGGVGMTTVAYLAVSPEGRTDGRQIVLREEALPGLARLTEAVHDEGAAVAAQIGHAGPVANGRANEAQALSASRMLSPLSLQRVRAATRADLVRVTRQYVDGARIAMRAGFDALEIHLGHNYLLSSFVSPNLNRRKDELGGALTHRAAFPRQVVKAVRDTVGDAVAVTAKISMRDGIRAGLQVDESLPFAHMLQEDGALDALQLSAGSSLTNPMYFFRGDVPLREFASAMPLHVNVGMRTGGTALPEGIPVRRGLPAAARTRVPRRLGHAADAARWHQPTRRPWTSRWPRASSTSRWPGRCCVSPTSSTRCRRGTPSRACASTATAACPPPTPHALRRDRAMTRRAGLA